MLPPLVQVLTPNLPFQPSLMSKTVITITSCSEHKCVATPVTTGVVVVTDIDTVYTTYCPLTNSQVYVPVKTVVCTEENVFLAQPQLL